MYIINLIAKLSSALKNRVDLYCYRKSIPKIVERVRSKDKIKVLFVLSDLSMWKTESLYLAMLRHPRFEPILGVTLLTSDLPSEVVRKYDELILYLSQNNYSYLEISSGRIDKIKPDVAFYQQPYESYIAKNVAYPQIIKNNGLICDVHYALRSLTVSRENSWIVDESLYRYCWKLFMENELNLDYGKLSIIKGKNMVATGVPWQDELMKPKKLFTDPWKPQKKRKKRIIYAPHHTLPDQGNLINLSCFLDVCDYIFEIANEFSEEVQFAFKPHPYLKRRLVNLWGEEEANAYYEKWDELENCQLVEDAYLSLFKYSDAMMHDCDSFTIEYCYMKKPVMYLISPDRVEERKSELNRFGQKAFDLHTHGFTKEDIHAFVSAVVANIDNLADKREQFYREALIPTHGKTAVDNIIESILG